MPKELPQLKELFLQNNQLQSLDGMSKDIDENVEIKLDYEKLDKYGKELFCR